MKLGILRERVDTRSGRAATDEITGTIARLDEMNAIWNPQANVYFELGRTEAAMIEGLSPQADTIEMKNSRLTGPRVPQKPVPGFARCDPNPRSASCARVPSTA
jgi:hypothetical protein